ncbi:unnamed protein product [Strongylus vulgaris]|uniref:Alpha-D-phosphohexomutase alpha/beta/alpha domain-containing protein n=1 Tax=Strongylus vulgaris TaxID=40348 RepID=A0A3P7IIE2_STRVU|nr:unnamed protein product [Strongylus vulgaris]
MEDYDKPFFTLNVYRKNLDDFCIYLDPESLWSLCFSGEWRVFTGNEMGALLTWWVWTNWHKANPNVNKSDVYMINSAVSSQIVKTIAEAEGFKSDVTLTGFKWMGNKADELRAKGKTVILAWEESIGYMPGHTLDKVSSNYSETDLEWTGYRQA